MPDLPQTTRSVADIKNGRLYLSSRLTSKGDPRTAVLQALSSRILGHREPTSYAEFLRQRVETNYLTGALLIPEAHAVPFLQEAKADRAISIEDLRDAYSVSYETAAHRFTNLATVHLGIPVHFLKVHESGTITKAYENDDVNFPTDRLGAIEGQMCCRKWTSRVVFDDRRPLQPVLPVHRHRQRHVLVHGARRAVERGRALGERRRALRRHEVVPRPRHPQPRRVEALGRGVLPPRARPSSRPPGASNSWPNVRTPRTLLATLPTGAFPGVDTTDVYEFLQAHAPALSRVAFPRGSGEGRRVSARESMSGRRRAARPGGAVGRPDASSAVGRAVRGVDRADGEPAQRLDLPAPRTVPDPRQPGELGVAARAPGRARVRPARFVAVTPVPT